MVQNGILLNFTRLATVVCLCFGCASEFPVPFFSPILLKAAPTGHLVSIPKPSKIKI